MKLLEVANVALDPSVIKKTTRVFNAAKKEIARYGKATAELKPTGPFTVQLIFDMQRYMHPEDIQNAYEDVSDAINKADVDGHIHKLEESGHGHEFVEALLTGLRPGMAPIKVDAFFPTLMWDITWKQIVSKK